MKLHASGADILSAINPISGGADRPPPPRKLGRHGLSSRQWGTAIPIGARILAVIDASMPDFRPAARPRLSDDQAFGILKERRGRMPTR
jgi:hypothetical protein